MVKQQCLFGTFLTKKVPGRHFLNRNKSVIQFFIFVFCSHTPPSAETIPPAGSPRISISAVPSDIRNSAVNTFRWNQQTSETSVIERVWGDPHQDKSHRMTGCQTAILLNMGGSCSVCVSLYITKRSEAVLQWGKRKNIKKMLNGMY